MKNKERGANAERELYKIFLENGFRAVRVAGSGIAEETACDLIAGRKGKRKYAIECKTTKKPYKYIDKKQIEEFLIFSEIFGLIPVIAVKFNRKGWYFFNPKDLERKEKNFFISLKLAEKKGKKFSQIFKY